MQWLSDSPQAADSGFTPRQTCSRRLASIQGLGEESGDTAAVAARAVGREENPKITVDEKIEKQKEPMLWTQSQAKHLTQNIHIELL